MALFIVSTPIGNLEDITLRALRVLKEVGTVIAEDTRHTGKLLKHYNISAGLLSFYERKEKTKLAPLLKRLKEGENMALVSDAGTPAISDPGFRLVRAAVEEGVEVVPVPGPTAAMAALSASGLPTDRFLFVGFLPEKPGKRGKMIEWLAKQPPTLILYLSKWKAVKQLAELKDFMGERKVCMARELTKIHETFWRGPLKDLCGVWAKVPPKGEITLIIEGSAEK